jgi:hypothetical protein
LLTRAVLARRNASFIRRLTGTLTSDTPLKLQRKPLLS